MFIAVKQTILPGDKFYCVNHGLVGAIALLDCIDICMNMSGLASKGPHRARLVQLQTCLFVVY